MRLRRLFTLAAVTAVLAGVVVGSGGAATNDVNGPKCADIVFGDAGYFIDSSNTGTFSAQLVTAAPACNYVNYTFYLSSDGGSTWIPVTGTIDSSGAVDFTHTFSAPAPNPICAYATSSIGGHVFDNAPDAGASGCILLDGTSGSGGFGNWN